MKVSDYEKKLATLRVLIMGLSGTGKSTLAATLSRIYNVIWIDTENSVDVLSNLPAEYKERIRLIKIPDTAAFPMASQTVQKLFKDKKGNICDKHGVIDCSACKKNNEPFELVDFNLLNPRTDIVVLDSLTQVGLSMMCHLLKTKPIDYKPERDDWGGLRKNTEYLAGNIQGAPINLVCTALPTEATLENGKTKLIPQFGSNPMCQIIGAKFSSVIYTDIVNKKHVAFSSSTHSNTILTKSRVGFKIEEQEVLDLCPMFESYLHGDTEDSDEVDSNTNNSGNTDSSNSVGIATNIPANPLIPSAGQNALAALKARNAGVTATPSLLGKK